MKEGGKKNNFDDFVYKGKLWLHLGENGNNF